MAEKRTVDYVWQALDANTGEITRTFIAGCKSRAECYLHSNEDLGEIVGEVPRREVKKRKGTAPKCTKHEWDTLGGISTRCINCGTPKGV